MMGQYVHDVYGVLKHYRHVALCNFATLRALPHVIAHALPHVLSCLLLPIHMRVSGWHGISTVQAEILH